MEGNKINIFKFGFNVFWTVWMTQPDFYTFLVQVSRPRSRISIPAFFVHIFLQHVFETRAMLMIIRWYVFCNISFVSRFQSNFVTTRPLNRSNLRNTLLSELKCLCGQFTWTDAYCQTAVAVFWFDMLLLSTSLDLWTLDRTFQTRTQCLCYLLALPFTVLGGTR